MDKQEKIVCAAIEFVVEDSFISSQHDKYVLCGIGYEEINDFNNSVMGREVLCAKNGFITDKNRFVDAKEAMEIAIEQDQILEINNCFAEFHEAQLAENFRKVNTLLGELQSLKLKHASRELKPEDLY